MLNHSLTIMYIVAAIAATIIIMSFCICRTFSKHPVCVVSDNIEIPRTSDNNGLLRTRLEITEGGLIKFSLHELNQATNNFGESNLIGVGRRGPIYKGLIGNTLMVAIKRLSGSLRPSFLAEENGQQMTVYEYLINFRALREAVDFKLERRISIALGAAKGLQHLHSLTPPMTHNRFKTDKVFFDIDLNAKVPDVGLSKLLATGYEDTDLEVGSVDQESFDKTKDVHNFGLFLAEFITGAEPTRLVSLTSNGELIDWISPRIHANTFVDMRLNGTYTIEVVKIIAKIMMQCLKFPATTRPNMKDVVNELEQIYPQDSTNEKGPTEITLGSQLFTI